MFDTLKQATQPEHSKLEKVLVQQLRNISTADNYLTILARLYGFYKPLEDRISSQINENLLSDIKQRQRTSHLLSDITALDPRAAARIDYASPPELESPSEALGALYVLEGSTMGGQVIIRMLSKTLQGTPGECTSYFNGYGKETHEMWQKFKSQVLLKQDQLREKDLITGASKTFRSLHNWLLLN